MGSGARRSTKGKATNAIRPAIASPTSQGEVHAPLVLMLLAFFAGGAILGVLAMTPTVVRYRRNSDHQKNAALAARTAGSAREADTVQPPQPDAY